MGKSPPTLPWLAAGEGFPPVGDAWGVGDPAPGLLAASAVLDVPTLIEAYSQGIFPWFNEGQPILWWCPNPRMVLQSANFRLHRSLRKTLSRFLASPHCEIRIDSAFKQVMEECAAKPRTSQAGTWILPPMLQAYVAMHRAGHAHSVETWINGKLEGGLYCVNIGAMVFGESMFAHQTDTSKIALCALLALCRANGISMIDCQQNTAHLASFGAAEIQRTAFVKHVAQAITLKAPSWHFETVYWNEILNVRNSQAP